ncbi:YceD family protein [Streptococcus castoreus]|uniref:YceD family protein n=1 Tax=Streptococcus castoreus TaxID=254786 RepID=UPI0003FF85F1|nr:DUF177 domain-containing protein [Streptococcus castoreus]
MLRISEIRKCPEGISFDQACDVKKKLFERDPQILDLENVRVVGNIQYDTGLYVLTYQLSYDLTLPSSRSLEAVTISESQIIEELFIEPSDLASHQNMIDDNLVLVLRDDKIDLEESIVDNILLAIPLQVLTDEEKKASQELPAGQDWAVLTEEQYQVLKEEKQKENTPFASLQELFDDES